MSPRQQKDPEGGPTFEDERGHAVAEGDPSFVGTDPIYENYANGSHKPYPFEGDEAEVANRQADFESGLAERAGSVGFQGFTSDADAQDPRKVTAQDKVVAEQALVREAVVKEASDITGKDVETKAAEMASGESGVTAPSGDDESGSDGDGASAPEVKE